MKKIAFLLLLFTSTFSAFAQNGQKVFLWKNNAFKAMAASGIDSITFSLADDAITFTTGDAYYIAENSFKAAFSVTSNLPTLQTAKKEVGVCWSRKYQEPTINNYVTVYQRELGDKVSWAPSFEYLYSGTTYYYRPYVMIDSVVFYGEVKSVSTYGALPSETVDEDSLSTDEKHGNCVDLGLSVKWAVCNLGATKPEEYGDFYAWGETSPKPDYMDYDADTYKYKDKNAGTYYSTKYDKYNGEDKKEVLEAEDDAATVTLKGSWRMPTYSECLELVNKCTWTTKVVNNINGYLVTGPNGKSIFLPANGYRSTSTSSVGEYGYYWSSTKSGSSEAYEIYFYYSKNSGSKKVQSGDRPSGRCIRPVLP